MTERKRLEQERRDDGRLPPGQALTLKWPVLHKGAVPAFDSATWHLDVRGLVENPFKVSWQEFQSLPRTNITADFHCVTTWSKFDNEWAGVLFKTVAERAKVKPEASFVMVRDDAGYETNVPLEDLMRDDVLLADWHSPEPLDPEHGAPLRLIVPHLYAWKSVKWVRGIEFMPADRGGYWEELGYHMRGDPFTEERFRDPNNPPPKTTE